MRSARRALGLALVLLGLAWVLTPHAGPAAPVASLLLALTFSGGFAALIAAARFVLIPEV